MDYNANQMAENEFRLRELQNLAARPRNPQVNVEGNQEPASPSASSSPGPNLSGNRQVNVEGNLEPTPSAAFPPAPYMRSEASADNDVPGLVQQIPEDDLDPGVGMEANSIFQENTVTARRSVPSLLTSMRRDSLSPSSSDNIGQVLMNENTSPVFFAQNRNETAGPSNAGLRRRYNVCRYCGYPHPGAERGAAAASPETVKRKVDSGDGDCKPGGGGGGDAGGKGDGDSGKKGDDDSKGGSGSSSGDDGGGGDAPAPSGGPPYSNADDPNVCPDWLTDAMCAFMLAVIVSCIIGLFWCYGAPSIKQCLLRKKSWKFGWGSKSTCDLTSGMLKELTKNKSSTPKPCPS